MHSSVSYQLCLPYQEEQTEGSLWKVLELLDTVRISQIPLVEDAGQSFSEKSGRRGSLFQERHLLSHWHTLSEKNCRVWSFINTMTENSYFLKTMINITTQTTLYHSHKEWLFHPRMQGWFIAYSFYSFKSKCAKTHFDVHQPSLGCLRCSEMNCSAASTGQPFAHQPAHALLTPLGSDAQDHATHCGDAVQYSSQAQTLDPELLSR